MTAVRTSSRKIPIARPVISENEKRRVMAVLDSGMLVAGVQVRAFEAAFAAYLGVEHAVATSSGTTALQVALEALRIGPGDRVVTTPFSFVATSNAILQAGAVPVFVDVDALTYSLDPDAVERAARDGARAVLCVHLYGLPCDLGPLLEIRERLGILLIEDCAQAHGATYRGQKVGTFGDAAVFSFYPSKNMTTGEGGMVVTGDGETAHRTRLLVNVGQNGSSEYVYEAIGYNYRMTDIAAAIGLGQLERLDEMNAIRRAHAARLTDGFAGVSWLTPPAEPTGHVHVYNQYTIRASQQRDVLAQHLTAAGIGHRVYYPSLIPDSPAYRKLGFGGAYPVATALTREVLSLPVHPALEDGDLVRIVEAVSDFSPQRA
ncbi:MAG TPA: DegT/DnrJ/EryC1/StrS family aminotransferase [bacterium]|jgi:perosamine synthetase